MDDLAEIAAVEKELTEFLVARDAGQHPDPEVHAARLSTAVAADFFRGAVRQLELAERHLPVPLEARSVLAGRYELSEELGSGGWGRVWRARDRKLGHDVAIKVLNAFAGAALDIDRLVEREGKLLAKLSHPGVVRVQDAGRDGDHRFLVMDLVGGWELADVVLRLRQLRLQGRSPTAADVLALVGAQAPGRVAVVEAKDPWPVAAAKIGVELLRTLEATHGVGVVHRDLKPGNIRLCAGGVPVLLDFGLGFTAGQDHGRVTGDMFGTALYAAPEQWLGIEAVGPHTDVYQAGVVLYELLTLQPCFDQESPVAAMRAIRDGRYRRPREVEPTLDARLEACVLRAMEVDPGRRYASAAAFRADLERWLAGELPLAAHALRTLGYRLRSFGRRHRVGLGLLLAAGLGAVAAGFWLGGSGPTVRWNDQNLLSVHVDAPTRMLAFRVARTADGRHLVAPVQLRAGAGQTSELAPSLPRGDHQVELEDVADAAVHADSVVSTMFVDVDDAAAERDFRGVVAALALVRRAIADRGGAWLESAEFEALLAQGRGGARVDVPIARLLVPGSWQRAGLQGIVVAR